MLIVLANRQDGAALSLATRWQSHDVHVVTPEGLSVEGWRYEVSSPANSRAVIANRPVAADEITGVLTRLPCVSDQDLPHFMPADRSYAASEMTAFLLAWLSGLSCPMLNRPVPGCICGPTWRTEQWVRFAAHLGIPVAPVHRKAPEAAAPPSESPLTEVVVVGNQCIGEVDPVLADRARVLAKAAGVGLLLVYFTGPDPDNKFVNASLWPDLWQPAITDAILDYFERRSRC